MGETRRFRPWLPVQVLGDGEKPSTSLEISIFQCASLQAVAAGTANADQQKIAIQTFMHICGIGDMSWMPEEHGGDRDSSFAAGKQHPGFQLRKLLNFPLTTLTGEKNGRPDHTRASGKPGDTRNADRARK